LLFVSSKKLKLRKGRMTRRTKINRMTRMSTEIRKVSRREAEEDARTRQILQLESRFGDCGCRLQRQCTWHEISGILGLYSFASLTS
jgi:hypothetical protein